MDASAAAASDPPLMAGTAALKAGRHRMASRYSCVAEAMSSLSNATSASSVVTRER